VCLVLAEESLVGPELRELGTALGRSPVELALHGGEDYALLATVPAGAAPEGFVHVGWCERAEPGGPELLLARADGSREPVTAQGFDHFG
jgi:thiamine-monophosphate kinase